MDADGLGELLRRARVRVGATQEELAERCGVSVRTISNLEGGRITAPRASSLRAIAAALGIDEAELRGEPARAGGLIREPLTRLLGRDDDLAALTDLLVGGSTRLVTVTGMAGIGKTRLALAVGRAVQRRGVPAWWVPLAALGRAELVAPAVAEAVGAREADPAAIGERIAERPAVLLVDNAEHLPGVDAVLVDLLDQLDGVRVLVTSRAPLRAAGEQEWPLAPLAVPPEDAPAAAVPDAPSAALLVERIRAATPGFELTDDEAGTVAQVCRLLDGLPLALELAAAQWRVRGGADVLRSIRDSPLELRDVGRGAGCPDHASLRAALDATAALLTPEQRDALAALSAFQGGWTLDAAAEVVGRDVLDDVDRLVALGLVQPADTPSGRRFGALPTVAAFAAATADERGLAEDAARRHAGWAARWVAERDLTADGVRKAAAALAAERDNLRAALTWFDAHDPDTGLRTASALYQHWNHSHAAEGLAWLTSLVDGAADRGARATALWQAAWLARELGRLADAERLGGRALAEADEPRVRVKALTVLANVLELRVPGSGVASHREAVAMAEEIGDPALSGNALSQLATCLGDLGGHEEAIALLRRAAEHGSTYARMGARLNIAQNLNDLGRHADALDALADVRPMVDAVGPPQAHTYWLAHRALALVGTGDLDGAEAAVRQADESTDEAENVYANEVRIAEAELAAARGDAPAAAAAFRAVLTARFPLTSPASRCAILAGLAATCADPGAAAAAIALVEDIRAEHGYEPPARVLDRASTAAARWSDGIGAGWTTLLAEARTRDRATLLESVRA